MSKSKSISRGGGVSLRAQVHIAKKALGMDDSTYRTMLLRITGKQSSADLNIFQLSNVVNEFKRLGWKPFKSRQAAKQYAQAHSRKLIMCWKDLHQTGHVADKSNKAMEAWVKSETGKLSPDWLTPAEAARLIEALKAWGKRPAKDGT